MDFYFNPYPGAANDLETGKNLVLDVANALCQLRKDLQRVHLSGNTASDDASLSDFIIVRGAQTRNLYLQDIISTANAKERVVLIMLLTMFSRGKFIEPDYMTTIENWELKNIDVAVPILEFAAKENAIALTIPTEKIWRVDVIEFKDREEILHNLWGQEDLSQLKEHCVNSIKNIAERFSIYYDAIFCDGAMNSAPDYYLWEKRGIFRQMNKAKMRQYKVDNHLIKIVGDTKRGSLLELRCLGEGQRIFFVYRNNATPQILIGGFYQKNYGVSQNDAIRNACERVNDFRIDID